MSRLLIVAIDALDRHLLERFAHFTPSFQRVRNGGSAFSISSTFPPDSDTAWATLTTGLNPAQHGIVRFLDPLDKANDILNVGTDNSPLHGRTYWDLAAESGLTAYALFPHLGYPIWPTRANVVARGGARTAELGSEPPWLMSRYPDPGIALGVRGFPAPGDRGLKAYAQSLVRWSTADGLFAQEIVESTNWDLCHVYFSALDAACHVFWNHFENANNGDELADVIPQLYKIYDEILGRLLSALDTADDVIVISDHGHGARPETLFHINRALRDAGLLFVSRDRKARAAAGAVEIAKNVAFRTVSRYGLGRPAARILRRFPALRHSITHPSSIDWDRTVACTSDMSGIKAYSYGGVVIDKGKVGRRYEAVRDDVIRVIREATHPSGASPIADWVARREDVYAGPYIRRYPDVLVKLADEFGVGSDPVGPLFGRATSRALVPGSHRGETAALLIRSQRRPTRRDLEPADFFHTVLDLLGIANHRGRDGLSAYTDST
jgi:predicted AlkP superfamily phosphohydrolase/phosphomutase